MLRNDCSAIEQVVTTGLWVLILVEEAAETMQVNWLPRQKAVTTSVGGRKRKDEMEGERGLFVGWLVNVPAMC